MNRRDGLLQQLQADINEREAKLTEREASVVQVQEEVSRRDALLQQLQADINEREASAVHSLSEKPAPCRYKRK